MSEWKVSKETIELFTHPNADRMEIAKVGEYQLVVEKNLYRNGDIIVFAPEKSILTGVIREEYQNYLIGKDKDRVKAIRLRNEISAGIAIPPSLLPDLSQYEIGEDISEVLGITKYIAPIPQCLDGVMSNLSITKPLSKHDCLQYRLYENDFVQGERIVASVKYHGSQLVYAYDFETDKELTTSKNQLSKELEIIESDTNTYWRAVRNCDLLNKVKNNFNSGVIQIFGEVVPVQGGFTYGYDPNHPVVLIFDIRINHVSIPYDQVPSEFKETWVKIVYDGALIMDEEERVLYEGDETTAKVTKTFYHFPQWLIDLSNAKENKGMERTSGKSLHIEEGIVVRPYIDRRAKDSSRLVVKMISDKYAKTETGEEFN